MHACMHDELISIVIVSLHTCVLCQYV
jgi:hypothetical protein